MDRLTETCREYCRRCHRYPGDSGGSPRHSDIRVISLAKLRHSEMPTNDVWERQQSEARELGQVGNVVVVCVVRPLGLHRLPR